MQRVSKQSSSSEDHAGDESAVQNVSAQPSGASVSNDTSNQVDLIDRKDCSSSVDQTGPCHYVWYYFMKVLIGRCGNRRPTTPRPRLWVNALAKNIARSSFATSLWKTVERWKKPSRCCHQGLKKSFISTMKNCFGSRVTKRDGVVRLASVSARWLRMRPPYSIVPGR